MIHTSLSLRSKSGLMRVSRINRSGGDDVKPRWTLPSKDYLKYTYQPSIPDKHFFGANWNYAPSTMWLRHYRPYMEEIASAGWKTAKDWTNCVLGPIEKVMQNNVPGIGHKIIAVLFMWGTFSYVARSTYGAKMEAWALLDKLHSFGKATDLAENGFWDTEEMDKAKRTQNATETSDRLQKLWETAIAESTKAKSFDVLCGYLAVSENEDGELPFTSIPAPVSWRFNMIPFDNVDAHTFPDTDRKDIAVEVKAHHDSDEHHDDHHGKHHVKLTAQKAKEIYASAVSAAAPAHH